LGGTGRKEGFKRGGAEERRRERKMKSVGLVKAGMIHRRDAEARRKKRMMRRQREIVPAHP
jgi:hypothetical protein